MFASALTAAALSVFVWGLSLTSVNAAGPRSECFGELPSRHPCSNGTDDISETYRVSSGDTCNTIQSWSGVTVSKLQSLNPGLNCAASMSTMVGHYVCLGTFTPTCTLNETATATSCVPLATAFSLTVSDFYQLNDNVDTACDNLVVGQPYCVSTADCFPGNTDPLCDGYD
ncbi:hypothetical protein BV25DRAFT_1734520 [Artomyces pyxidatus]|uniref:Uncharacterized protein n=2 Tax=Artomyces pyxidatus TaxID=48021 RepID=A0ACB8SJ25_9AGAM|nr:hypothetical protein BV25DRAFT_176312 [Artomyces pyxidatus]KAI0055716.1 hypothetical protein BV25DRAFT_1734520 [Artomyces pyxidatus]